MATNENGKRDLGPSVQIARLFQKKSASGSVYFVGRMGGARLGLLKAKEQPKPDSIVWNLLVQQSEQKQPAGAERDTAAKRDWQKSAPPTRHSDVGIDLPARGFDKMVDDEIPFAPEFR
jgi:hypothetical protein